MCQVYAGTKPTDYAQVTRSVRLHRVVTSIRLENRFWAIIDRMAAEEGTTTPRFLAVLYDEVLEQQGAVRNFASLLRVACTTYLARRSGLDPAELANEETPEARAA